MWAAHILGRQGMYLVWVKKGIYYRVSHSEGGMGGAPPRILQFFLNPPPPLSKTDALHGVLLHLKIKPSPHLKNKTPIEIELLHRYFLTAF